MKQNVCRYNKYGYCKFGDKCQFRHNNALCVNKKCNVFDCEKRHPVVCKYFNNFKKCKFSNCAYKHEAANDGNEIGEKIKKLETRMNEIENNEKTVNSETIETKLEAFEKNYMGKVEALECRIKEMVNMMNEKDAVISSSEKLIQQQQKTLESMDKKMKNLEEKLKTKQNRFKCKQCDFASEFEKGLKTHIQRKHKTEDRKEESVKFPRICDVCEKEIKNNKEMKTHMKIHTYRFVNVKCNECDFLAESLIDMSVHIGKAHGENFECGLCEYIAEDLENLDMHLFTCEVYKCSRCEPKFKSLSEVKTHFETDHDDLSEKFRNVEHIKRSRDNEHEFSITSHNYIDMFSQSG